MITKEIFQESLLNTYRTWHDVFLNENVSELPLLATAEFRSRNERFVLVKQAKLWAAESYEFSYIFSLDKLDEAMAKECVYFALSDGMPKIKPHSEHMCSFISVIFIANEVDSSAISYIKKAKNYKSFHFSLHGWMALKVLAKDVGKGLLYTNRSGKDLKKTFVNVQKACEKKQEKIII